MMSAVGDLVGTRLRRPRVAWAVFAVLILVGVFPSSSGAKDGDTTGPAVREFSLSGQSVDTSSASQSVNIRARITDDFAGTDTPDARCLGPNGQTIGFFRLTRVSGTPNDGVYEGACVLPRYAARGTWTADLVLQDRASNTSYYFSQRLIDEGYDPSFENVDRTPPDLTLDSGPVGASNDTTPTFGFSPEPGVALECSVDTGSAAWGACSDPASHTPSSPLADGDYTFRVRATDSAGNPTTRTRAFSVDTSVPDAQIDSGPSGPTSSASPSFGFSASETGAQFDCRLDSSDPSAWQSCSSPKSYSGLDQGPHTFEVRARDAAGNIDQTPATRSFTVDTVAPTLTLDSGPSGPTPDSTPSFGFAPESGAAVECSVDSGTPNFGACSDPASHTPTQSLTDGAYTFRVRATDSAGNEASRERSFSVDTAIPETAITDGPTGLTTNNSPAFEFSSPEAGVSFECRLDSSEPAAWQICSSSELLPPLSEGAHTFEVRARDAAGNVDPSPASRSFRVDTVPPTLSIDPAPDATADPTPTFGFSAGSDAFSIECSIDGADGTDRTSCSGLNSHTPASPLADGDYTFWVVARDEAGNATYRYEEFRVDTAVPDTRVNSGPAGPTSSASPAFSFSASEPDAKFDCRIDSGAWRSCSSPKSYSGLDQGAHLFEVRSRDAAGNVDESPAGRSFEVDTVAPVVKLTKRPKSVIKTRRTAKATFGFTTDDATAAFECSLGAATFRSCTSPKTYTGLKPGRYRFRVRASDEAGNADTVAVAFRVSSKRR